MCFQHSFIVRTVGNLCQDQDRDKFLDFLDKSWRLLASCLICNDCVVNVIVSRSFLVGIEVFFAQDPTTPPRWMGTKEINNLLFELGLILAATNGYVDVFDTMIKHPSCPPTLPPPILVKAISNGNLDIIDRILALGIDLQDEDIFHSACSIKRDYPDIVDRLLCAGAAYDKQLAVISASESGNIPVLERFISLEWDIDFFVQGEYDEEPISPLEAAILSETMTEAETVETVNYLLSKGSKSFKKETISRGTWGSFLSLLPSASD